ncbi:MAG: four helix bundle protein [Acidobacteria bacterium]|nr:four helix bundle protein [Acidobacteriota bacterium]
MAPKLTSIEDRTYTFSLSLIHAYRKRPPADVAEKVIWVQLLKSGTSAGANSSEGPGAQSRKEWLTRRHIALKEMHESHFWLRLLRDSDPRPGGSALDGLIDESDQLIAILTATVKSARANDRHQNG